MHAPPDRSRLREGLAYLLRCPAPLSLEQQRSLVRALLHTLDELERAEARPSPR